MSACVSALNKCSLLNGISKDNYENVLTCLGAKQIKYKANDVLYDTEEIVDSAGIVISGVIEGSMVNREGVKYSVRRYMSGELFGEGYGCIQGTPLPVRICAVCDSEVLIFYPQKLFSEKASKCPYATRVSLNLLREISNKNAYLTKKMEIITQKRIRDRLRIYLGTVTKYDKTTEIPFNRQDMADFLGVDRSALSRELSSMRDDGILEFDKRTVRVVSPDFL